MEHLIRDLGDKFEAGIAQGVNYWIARVRLNEARDEAKIRTIEYGDGSGINEVEHVVNLEMFQNGWLALGYRNLEDHEWDEDHADAALQKAIFGKIIYG
jgi:hypothetical protein